MHWGTEAGTHPKVSSLVYITAFAPDKGGGDLLTPKIPPKHEAIDFQQRFVLFLQPESLH